MDNVERVRNLKVWRRRDQRAPHKPLLLLYMIGRYLNGQPRMIPFRQVAAPLTALLEDFGPSRGSYHPEYPFYYLYSDGFWDLEPEQLVHNRAAGKTVSKRKLLASDARGGVSQEFYASLRSPAVASDVIVALLEENFPDTYHEDILRAVGIDVAYAIVRRTRDPRFRRNILRAYEYSCAICGFSGRVENTLVGVEAAHIKWHQAGGPDSHPNGVALCALHHKLFDRGVLTFTPDFRILVSEKATGSAMFSHLVTDFHGRHLSNPVRPQYKLDPQFVSWHVREVFHRPGRYMLSA